MIHRDTLGKNIMNVCYKSFPDFPVDCQYSTGFLHVKDSSLSLQGLPFGSKIKPTNSTEMSFL